MNYSMDEFSQVRYCLSLVRVRCVSRREERHFFNSEVANLFKWSIFVIINYWIEDFETRLIININSMPVIMHLVRNNLLCFEVGVLSKVVLEDCTLMSPHTLPSHYFFNQSSFLILIPQMDLESNREASLTYLNHMKGSFCDYWIKVGFLRLDIDLFTIIEWSAHISI